MMPLQNLQISSIANLKEIFNIYVKLGYSTHMLIHSPNVTEYAPENWFFDFYGDKSVAKLFDNKTIEEAGEYGLIFSGDAQKKIDEAFHLIPSNVKKEADCYEIKMKLIDLSALKIALIAERKFNEKEKKEFLNRYGKEPNYLETIEIWHYVLG